MKTQKHHWILYLISCTILITIVVQFYWNYRNYQENKQRVMNEIQLSLDNAIEQYFADLSKKNHFAIVTQNSNPRRIKKFLSTTVTNKDSLGNNLESINIDIQTDNKTTFKDFIKSNGNKQKDYYFKSNNENNIKVFTGKKASDSLKLIKGLETIVYYLSVTYKSFRI